MATAMFRSSIRSALRGGASRVTPASKRTFASHASVEEEAREAAKWEKITYVAIITSTILAVVNLAKGHSHSEEPPISETGREKGKRDDGQSWWRADLVRKFEPAVEGKNWLFFWSSLTLTETKRGLKGLVDCWEKEARERVAAWLGCGVELRVKRREAASGGGRHWLLVVQLLEFWQWAYPYLHIRNKEFPWGQPLFIWPGVVAILADNAMSDFLAVKRKSELSSSATYVQMAFLSPSTTETAWFLCEGIKIIPVHLQVSS
ncbi:Cytochrome c oxidase subunit 6a, mitochondrial [Capsicum annuum]|nr:Cytochrome c oxidase subunit 6a, mitochondrial [Capsicum annuum]